MKKLISKQVAGLSSLALVFGLLALSQAQAATYEVKSGDTLSQIAQTNQTSVETLQTLNQLDNIDFLEIGQTLEIPEVEISNQDNSQEAEEVTSSNLSQADAEAKEIIAQRESGGSYTAQNGQYYGRYQLTISYLNGDLSPENQERVADDYVTNRYGSWSVALAFWNANGWY